MKVRNTITTIGRTRLTLILVILTVMMALPSFAAMSGSDTDKDGIIDAADNCGLVWNQKQSDADRDGYGDACDGDLTQDAITNESDFSAWRKEFACHVREADRSKCSRVCDHDEDKVCDGVDLFIFRNRLYGQPPGPSHIDF